MVRLAKKEEIETVINVYSKAREFMKDSGNPYQWGNSYPEKKIVENDIENNQLYVIENDRGEICGCFALIYGNDPTYEVIEAGQWLSDEPYAAIHRVASDCTERGVFAKCVDFARKKYNHLRIDTYKDNKTMQDVILKNRFEYCGIIYTEDGSPRLAYEWVNGK